VLNMILVTAHLRKNNLALEVSVDSYAYLESFLGMNESCNQR
jgi:hypothetical protein